MASIPDEVFHEADATLTLVGEIEAFRVIADWARKEALEGFTTETRVRRLEVSPRGRVAVKPIMEFEERLVGPWQEAR